MTLGEFKNNVPDFRKSNNYWPTITSTFSIFPFFIEFILCEDCSSFFMCTCSSVCHVFDGCMQLDVRKLHCQKSFLNTFSKLFYLTPSPVCVYKPCQTFTYPLQTGSVGKRDNVNWVCFALACGLAVCLHLPRGGRKKNPKNIHSNQSDETKQQCTRRTWQ